MQNDTRYRILAILLLVLTMTLSACTTAPTGGTAQPTAQPTTNVTEEHPEEEEHSDAGEHAEGEEHSEEELLVIPDLNGIAVADGEKLRVVATTSIIGDVVRNVAGDTIDLTVLMAEGQDPHSYQPTAADLTVASQAHIVFVNGWDLEEGLIADLEGAVENGVIVPISAGIEPFEGAATHDEHSEEDEEHAEEEEHMEEGEHAEHEHPFDPHVWFDPANVLVWVHNTEEVLSAVDPANATTYHDNAGAYEAQLAELEHYITDGVAKIPEANRKLVTNHDNLGYFARAYGFEVIGTILPGVSTGTEPSAADLTELIEAVNTAEVKAVFIENTVGEGLATVLNEETGAQVYELYTDAVGPVGSGAETYIGMVKADVDILVEALQ